jgi:hypothetical protein
MKLRVLFVLCVVLVLGTVGSATAAPGAGTCSGGSIPAGTYNGFTVTGNCTVAGDVTINGNLFVADGAVLNDHAASTAMVHVTGNVIVGRGAVLGLGDYNPSHNSATVDGNIIANQPLTLYLGAMTVHGNVVSNGGGDPGRNFPIKDDRIGGNLIIQGWSGLWLGVIRTTVGGNVIVSNNRAADTSHDPGADSTEVQTNHISGNLICQGNSPAAQVNPDDGGLPNIVGGNKIGQCAGL